MVVWPWAAAWLAPTVAWQLLAAASPSSSERGETRYTLDFTTQEL